MSKPNYKRLDVTSINTTTLQIIKQKMQMYPGDKIMLNMSDTSNLSLYDVDTLIYEVGSNNVVIRIAGGYDDERVHNYTSAHHVEFHKYDNIYSLQEMKSILKEIHKIESGLNPNWTKEQKLIYFIGYLKDKIVYHPFFEKAPSRDIRSLRGLYSHQTVCAGYAMILKELCDRNGIICQYVEGSCSKEDDSKGYLTHAWNIVQINGNFIPVDLTWVASKSNSGKTLSLEDMANVNEFVKSHYPGKHEKIQNYASVLKSIDGKYLRIIDGIVNKDKTYDMFICQRKNGEKFVISQVREEVVNNEYLYTYVYMKYQDNGKFGPPMIFYSKTNVALTVSRLKRKNKLESQLLEASRKGNTKKVEELKKQLKGSEYLIPFNGMIDNLLFSKENIKAALTRGDYYLGEVKLNIDNSKKATIDGVVVDPNFCKERKERQRTFIRSNGSSFVLETYSTVKINDYSVFRYKMYELVTENGEYVLKKNTIFTDEDLLSDYRPGIANDFLSRSRIDRKAKETGGYLGYYSKQGVRTYIPSVNRVFYAGIFQYFAMRQDHIRNYYAELTFDDMKKLATMYDIQIISGKEVVVNRYTNKPVVNENLVVQIKFAILWLRAAGTKAYQRDIVPGYTYAFEVESAKKVFDIITNCINSSINKFGIIDPVDILQNVKENCGSYKYAEEIVVQLFQNGRNVDLVNKLFLLQNPSSVVKDDNKIEPLYNQMIALRQLLNRKKQDEERRRQMLEVVEEQGNVEIKPYRR